MIGQLIALYWQDVWVAILSMLDSASGAVLSLNYGYLLLPSAFGLLAGGILSLLFQSVTPVGFQQEGLILAAKLAKTIDERITIILGAAVLMVIVGLAGLPEWIVKTVGESVFYGMLSGVGLFLFIAALLIMWENDRVVGTFSIVLALIVQFWRNDLVWTITISVLASIALKWILVSMGRSKLDTSMVPTSIKEQIKKEFKLPHLVWNRRVLKGLLSVFTLSLGSSVGYTAVNLSLAPGAQVTYNQVTFINGITDFFSSLFGGASMEVIISGTAGTPHPVISGAILMIGTAILILTGGAFFLARRISVEVMAGYLAAIAIPLVFVPNVQGILAMGGTANYIMAAVACGVTAKWNPFYGLLAGVAAKLALGALGVL